MNENAFINMCVHVVVTWVKGNCLLQIIIHLDPALVIHEPKELQFPETNLILLPHSHKTVTFGRKLNSKTLRSGLLCLDRSIWSPDCAWRAI